MQQAEATETHGQGVVRCETCFEKGVDFCARSKRWEITVRRPRVFRDKHNKDHCHDPNVVYVTYVCPIGHITIHAEDKRQCWCGWKPSG